MMLKIKIVTAVLALMGMVSLLLGDTYLSAAFAVACTAIASPLSLHLTLRWIMKEDIWLARFYVALWAVFSALIALYVLQDVEILSVSLGTAIEPLQKAGDVGCYVSCMGCTSVVLATIAPWSPPKCDDEDDEG